MRAFYKNEVVLNFDNEIQIYLLAIKIVLNLHQAKSFQLQETYLRYGAQVCITMFTMFFGVWWKIMCEKFELQKETWWLYNMMLMAMG